MNKTLKSLMTVALVAVGMVGVASAVPYDPADDIASVKAAFELLVTTGMLVIVAALGAGLSIAGVVWVFNKVRAKLFGTK